MQRRLVPAVVSLLAVFCIVLVVLPAGATTSYDMDVSPQTEVPSQTVTVEGESFDVDSLTAIDAGTPLDVDLTIPGGERFGVGLYNSDGQFVVFEVGQGNSEETLPTSRLEPGTYVLALNVDNEYQVVQPVVINGYEIDLTYPAEVESGEEFELEATLTETDASGPPADVEVAVWDEDSNDIVEEQHLNRTNGLTYETTLSLEETGSFNVSVAALDDRDDEQQSLAYTEGPSITVEEAPTIETATRTIDETALETDESATVTVEFVADRPMEMAINETFEPAFEDVAVHNVTTDGDESALDVTDERVTGTWSEATELIVEYTVTVPAEPETEWSTISSGVNGDLDLGEDTIVVERGFGPFLLSDLDRTTVTGSPEETESVSVTVSNEGDVSHDVDLALTIEGEDAGTQQVADLDPGESRSATVELPLPAEPGTYEFSLQTLNDTAAGTLDVQSDDSSDGEPENGEGPSDSDDESNVVTPADGQDSDGTDEDGAGLFLFSTTVFVLGASAVVVLVVAGSRLR